MAEILKIKENLLSSLDVKNNFAYLPENLLVEIFNFLPTENLLALSLVCRKFNKIISNEEKLQEKLNITIDFKIPGVILSGTRNNIKFKHRFFTTATEAMLYGMLNEVGNNVKQISLKNRCNGELIPILNILMKCPNLKIFKSKTFDEKAAELEGKILPVLNLDLVKTNDRSLLALFMKSTVKRLEIIYYPISYAYGGDPAVVRKFLKTSKDLKHLVCKEMYCSSDHKFLPMKL